MGVRFLMEPEPEKAPEKEPEKDDWLGVGDDWI